MCLTRYREVDTEQHSQECQEQTKLGTQVDNIRLAKSIDDLLAESLPLIDICTSRHSRPEVRVAAIQQLMANCGSLTGYYEAALCQAEQGNSITVSSTERDAYVTITVKYARRKLEEIRRLEDHLIRSLMKERMQEERHKQHRHKCHPQPALETILE